MKSVIKRFILRFPRLRGMLFHLGLGLPEALPIWEKKPDQNNGYRSQYGQDHWVVERVFPGRSKPGFFIEMGAGDGLLLSNTAVLEKKLSWRGLLVEPSHKFEQLKTNREVKCINACISNEEGKIYIAEIPGPSYLENDPNNTLRSMTIEAPTIEAARLRVLAELPKGLIGRVTEDRIVVREIECMTMRRALYECCAPKTIDYMSLDVEGHEYEIMAEFPFDEYKILSMNIERPNKKLQNLLRKKNYKPVARNQCDWFYLHRSMLEQYWTTKESHSGSD